MKLLAAAKAGDGDGDGFKALFMEARRVLQGLSRGLSAALSVRADGGQDDRTLRGFDAAL